MSKEPNIVRRPDFAGGGITDDERARMAELVQLWTARAMRTDPIDRDAITSAIVALYAAANLPAPRVVIVPSPLVMAIAGGFASAIWHMRKTGSSVATHAATDEATRAVTRAATYAATHVATHAATDEATRAATYAATRAATHAATADATRVATHAATYAATDEATGWARRLAKQIGGPIELMVACCNRWAAMYQGGNMWATWACYLAAARDVLGLRLPQQAAYESWEQAAIHGGFRYMHAEFCMVTDFPRVLRVDERRRPHCADGPSHEWRDGWALYYWHGVSVPREWIMERDRMDVRAVLADANVERRRAGMEILGWDRALEALDATVVDTDVDPRIGTLLRCDLPDAPRSQFLRVRCATERDFVLPVPPNCRTALAANAWSYGLPPDQLRLMQARS